MIQWDTKEDILENNGIYHQNPMWVRSRIDVPQMASVVRHDDRTMDPVFRPTHSPQETTGARVVWSSMPPFENLTMAIYGGFHTMGVPQNSWFMWKIPLKIDDLGLLLFQKTSINNSLFNER